MPFLCQRQVSLKLMFNICCVITGEPTLVQIAYFLNIRIVAPLKFPASPIKILSQSQEPPVTQVRVLFILHQLETVNKINEICMKPECIFKTAEVAKWLEQGW